MVAKEFISWKSIYETGIQQIDDEHKNLLNILNNLHRCFIQKEGSKVGIEIFKNLIEYTKTHFFHEEEIMRKAKYPKYDEHKNEHRILTRQVVDFFEIFEKQQDLMTANMLEFLKDWLQYHIKIKDIEFSVWKNDNEKKA